MRASLQVHLVLKLILSIKVRRDESVCMGSEVGSLELDVDL